MPLWPARLTWDRVHLVNGSYLCQPAGIRVVSNCHGQTNWRLVRYADFVVLVHGNRLDAETPRTEVAGVLAPMDLRPSVGKTLVVKIDEGFDFLGFRFQRHEKRGTNRRCVYTYPSKKAVTAIKD
jgi:RNA-directed DNA polymerase